MATFLRDFYFIRDFCFVFVKDFVLLTKLFILSAINLDSLLDQIISEAHLELYQST